MPWLEAVWCLGIDIETVGFYPVRSFNDLIDTRTISCHDQLGKRYVRSSEVTGR
jgi:hypothetical protein